MSSSEKSRSGSDSGVNTASKKTDCGMSLSEAHKRLGLDISLRQFRRYVEMGVIPSKKVGKTERGWLVLTDPPTTDLGWTRLDRQIQKWRAGRYERGWGKRPRKVAKQHSMVGNDSLEAIHMDFLRWKSRSEGDGFPGDWNASQHRRVLDLLEPMREVANQSAEALRSLIKQQH
jgi:hypothetical protein